MKVCISGGGIAGLACASYLRRLPSISSIHIIEAKKTESFHAQKKYTGLWTPALNVLDDLLPANVTKRLFKEASFIEGSGYRDYTTTTGGQWLMRPAEKLQPYVSGSSLPSLGFFENGALLAALRENLAEKGRVPVSIRYGAEVTGIGPGGKVMINSDKLQDQFDCNLLIAADGTDSAVFRALFGQEATAGRLKYRGYDVYRGLTRQPQEEVGDPFQMWGPGARFAMVPIKRDGLLTKHSSGRKSGAPRVRAASAANGHSAKDPQSETANPEASGRDYAWFAAVTGTDAGATAGNAGGRQNLSPIFSGPFANGSRTAGPAQLDVLQGRLYDWEVPPVPSVLSLARHIDYSDVTVTPAWSSIKVESLSKHYENVDGQYSAAANCDSKDALPIAFCGDAFHTFDPILAIGGGLALEQARALYLSLDRVSCSSSGGNGSVAGALKEYDSKIAIRAQRLSVLSDIAQRFGHVKSPLLSMYRNSVLSFLPSSATGRVMSMMIRVVADCESSPSPSTRK